MAVPPADLAPFPAPPAPPERQPPFTPAPVENPPPALADPPAAPPQPPADAAEEPAPVAPRQPVAAATEKSPLDMLLTYGVPGVAFVAVTGLVLVFALTSLSRKGQPVRRPANRSTHPAPRRLAATQPPSTAVSARPVSRPAAADDDVLELGPEDIIPTPPRGADQPDAPRASPPSSDDWPRLEL